MGPLAGIGPRRLGGRRRLRSGGHAAGPVGAPRPRGQGPGRRRRPRRRCRGPGPGGRGRPRQRLGRRGPGRPHRPGARALDAVMLRHVLAHNGGAEDAIVAHLATLVRPGGCLYLADVDATAIRTLPEQADLTDLQERYAAFRAARGDDNRAGLRLADRLGQGRPGGARVPRPLLHRPAAAVGPARRRGRPGRRWSPPGWPPRTTSAAGTGRSRRSRRPRSAPTIFAPLFTAVGRRPA